MSVNVKQFDAKGDGVTNDTAAVARALAAIPNGGVVYFPSGVYNISFSGTNALAIPANVTLQGESKRTTELLFAPQNNSFKNIFGTVSVGVTFLNLRMRVNWVNYGADIIFMTMNSNLVVDNCIVDGGVTDNGTKQVYNAYFLNTPMTAATITDITVKNSEFTRFSFVFLKPNGSLSTEQRIRVLDNDLYGNYVEDISFNSPNGICRDVIVSNNIFRRKRPFGSKLYCAFSSVNTFQVTNNQFYDSCTDAIHMEENCQNGCVSNNTINVDGNGIILLAEKINSQGIFYMPQNIVISGNTITKQGGQTNTGVMLIWNGNSVEPGKRIVVSGNIITGFDTGLLTAAFTDSATSISNNVCHSCNTGYFITRGYGALTSNKSSYCNVGVRNAEKGGFARSHTFIECRANVSAFQGPLLLVDPIFEWKHLTPSTAAFNLFPWNKGHVAAAVTLFTPEATRVDEINAAPGSGFKKNTTLNTSNGSVSLDIVDAAGMLSVRITAGVATKLVAILRGSVTINP
jgi:hypothetical protein